MNEIRPKIKLHLSKIDKTIEITSWLILFTLCTYTIIEYSNLPNTIPIHFNSVGKADGFGNKVTILIIPIIAIFLMVIMSLVNKIPHHFNYPTKITAENALKQYQLASNLIRYLKLAIVYIFSQITVSTILVAHGKKDGLGIWFLPLSIGLIFTLITVFIIQSKKNIK